VGETNPYGFQGCGKPSSEVKSRTVYAQEVPYGGLFQPYRIYGYVNVRCLLEARTVLQGEVPTGWVGNTVRCWTREGKGKVSRTVVSEVEISHLKPVRDDMQEARTVLQNIVDITWGGGGKVGNGETMVARASTGRGRRAWGGGRWLATPSPCR